jgi:purine-nucleoside phosphorylase
MSSEAERAAEAAGSVLGDRKPPRIGVVLGSGLGAFAERLRGAERVGYHEIPHFTLPGVQGHAGALWLGLTGDVPVACLQGRVHLYEGHPPAAVVFGVRVLAALGCGAVILSNAAGGIDASMEPGDLMLIVDHLNLTGENPLAGAGDSERFVDMSCAYDAELSAAARLAGRAANVKLHEGVYAGVRGPSYETPAEISMLRTLGAHAVGMSTVLEVIMLRRLGVRVGAVSAVTNFAAGLTPHPLEHAEVERVARAASGGFVAFLDAWVARAGALVPPH